MLRTASNLDQQYTSFNANVNKLFGNHDLKFGLKFLRTKVDGVDTRMLHNQLFATTDDFASFGAVNAGLYLLPDVGGLTSAKTRFICRTTTPRCSCRTIGSYAIT